MTDKVPKPKFREYTIGGLVKTLEKEEFNKPQPTYNFSGGRVMYDTDRSETGIYKK